MYFSLMQAQLWGDFVIDDMKPGKWVLCTEKKEFVNMLPTEVLPCWQKAFPHGASKYHGTHNRLILLCKYNSWQINSQYLITLFHIFIFDRERVSHGPTSLKIVVVLGGTLVSSSFRYLFIKNITSSLELFQIYLNYSK